MILLFTVYIGTVVMKELAGRTSASLPHPLWFGVWSLSQERPQQKWREYTSHSVTHTKQTHHHTRTHIHTHTTQTHHHTPTLTHTKQRRAYSLMHARAHTHTLHKHTTTHTHTFGLTLTFVVARSTKYCDKQGSKYSPEPAKSWKLHKSYDVWINHPSFGKYDHTHTLKRFQIWKILAAQVCFVQECQQHRNTTLTTVYDPGITETTHPQHQLHAPATSSFHLFLTPWNGRLCNSPKQHTTHTHTHTHTHTQSPTWTIPLFSGTHWCCSWGSCFPS